MVYSYDDGYQPRDGGAAMGIPCDDCEFVMGLTRVLARIFDRPPPVKVTTCTAAAAATQ